MHLTKNDRLNIAVVSVTVDQRVQRRKMLNKMTECIFNALAFLLFCFSPYGILSDIPVSLF